MITNLTAYGIADGINVSYSRSKEEDSMYVSASISNGDLKISLNRTYTPDGNFTPSQSTTDMFTSAFNEEVKKDVLKLLADTTTK